MNKNQSVGIYLLIAVFLVAALSVAFKGPNTSTSEISYTQFLNKVQMGTIESVHIAKDTLIAIPKDNEIKKEEKHIYSCIIRLVTK